MVSRLQKQPVLTYVPGVTAVAAKPAYCYTYQEITSYKEAEIVVRFIPLADGNIPSGAIPVYKGNGAYGTILTGYTITEYSNGASIGSYGGSPLIPVYTECTVCYPEVAGVAGVAPKIIKSANNGWNSGARSASYIPEGSYVKVDIPSDPIGVLFGLSDGQFSHTYGSSRFALVARPSGITPIENGQNVYYEQPLSGTLIIARSEGMVRMIINGEIIYSSPNEMRGDMYAISLLYASSDYVTSPFKGSYHELAVVSEFESESFIDHRNGSVCLFTVENDAIATLNGVAMLSVNSRFTVQNIAQGLVTYKPKVTTGISVVNNLAGYGYFGKNGNITSGINYASGKASFAGYASYSGHAKSHGSFSRPVLNARANKPEVEVIEASGIYPAPIFSGHLLSGVVLESQGFVSFKGKASDAAYFGGKAPAATINRLVAWQSYLGDDQLDGSEMVISIDQFRLETNALFILHEGIGVSDTVDFYLIINIEAYDGIAVNGSVSLSSIIELAISERVAISGSSSVARKEALQYAVNAVTGALSTYRNFGFKQFATVRGETYAITDSGLYKLTGDTDNGDLLNASIDFGASDFGTSQLKRVSSVYAGVNTNGDVYIRMTADEGQERIYKAITEPNECRVKTAKGLAARHWRVRLELTDASYADIDNLEIEVGVSQRRLRGSR